MSNFIMKVAHACISFLLFMPALLHAAESSSLLPKLLLLDLAHAGNTIVAVGERGHVVVLGTSQTGKVIQTGTKATLTAVCFINETHGWAVGHDAVILKTTNGGLYWQQVYEKKEAVLLDVWFADDAHGIAIGAYGLYLTTDDGGATWQQREMNITNIITDLADHDEHVPETGELHLNAIAQSASGRLYIVTESGLVYASDDMGNTWNVLDSPYSGSLFGILPLQQEALLVFGLRGHLYYSEDAGSSWIKVESHTRELLLSAVQLQSGEIMVAGMGGVVLASRDQGKTFKLHVLEMRSGLSAINENAAGHVFTAGEHGLRVLNLSFPGATDD